MSGASARIFRDARLDRRFRRQGWVVVEPWGEAEASSLVGLHERLDDGLGDGYYTSTASPRLEYRREVDRHILEVFGPALTDLLVDYEAYLGALVVKQPHGPSVVHAHQDGTCNDEEPRPGVVAWIPATPLDDGAGLLRGLWGSHRYTPGIRSTPPTRTEFEDVRDEVLAGEMEAIPTRLGQAILFDSRLVHGSEPNRSGRVRLAGYVRLHPRGVPGRHYWWDRQADLVHGYEVDREFFLSHVWTQPPGQPSDTTFAPPDPEQVTIDELRRRRRRARLRPPAWD